MGRLGCVSSTREQDVSLRPLLITLTCTWGIFGNKLGGETIICWRGGQQIDGGQKMEGSVRAGYSKGKGLVQMLTGQWIEGSGKMCKQGGDAM